MVVVEYCHIDVVQRRVDILRFDDDGPIVVKLESTNNIDQLFQKAINLGQSRTNRQLFRRASAIVGVTLFPT